MQEDMDVVHVDDGDSSSNSSTDDSNRSDDDRNGDQDKSQLKL